MVEHELRVNLRACAEAFAKARKVSPATVGRLAAGDWRFFDRLDDDEKTFTARKYDEVIGWFAANWPADTEWPQDVRRASPSDEPTDSPAAAEAHG